MRKTLATLATLGFALTLTACGGDKPSTEESPATTAANATPSPTAVPGKGNISSSGVDFTTLTDDDLKLTTDDDFYFTSSAGTEGTIEFIPSTDPRVKKYEDYRKATHGYPVAYLVSEVDNRKGTESANMFQINVFNPEGAKYSYTNMDEILSDWQPITDYDTDTYSLPDGTKLSNKEYIKLYNEGVDLTNNQVHSVDQSEKNTVIRAMPADAKAFPIEVERIAVLAHGAFDEVNAYNELVSQYREWKAFQEAGKEWEAYDPSAAPMD